MRCLIEVADALTTDVGVGEGMGVIMGVVVGVGVSVGLDVGVGMGTCKGVGVGVCTPVRPEKQACCVALGLATVLSFRCKQHQERHTYFASSLYPCKSRSVFFVLTL